MKCESRLQTPGTVHAANFGLHAGFESRCTVIWGSHRSRRTGYSRKYSFVSRQHSRFHSTATDDVSTIRTRLKREPTRRDDPARLEEQRLLLVQLVVGPAPSVRLTDPNLVRSLRSTVCNIDAIRVNPSSKSIDERTNLRRFNILDSVPTPSPCSRAHLLRPRGVLPAAPDARAQRRLSPRPAKRHLETAHQHLRQQLCLSRRAPWASACRA